MACEAIPSPAVGPGRYDGIPPKAQDALERYWNRLVSSGLGWQSVRANHSAVRRCLRELQEAGRGCTPETINEADILYLRNEAFKRLSPDTQKWYVALFGRFLALEAGNDVVSRMRLRWPPAESHPRVDWLDEKEASAVMNAELDAPEAFAKDLMLLMGLRRVEVIRLRVGDISNAGIKVRGKGGKVRFVPWASKAREDCETMMQWRAEQVQTAKSADSEYIPPDNVFLTRTASPGPYSEMGTSFDGTVLAPIREASGVDFSAHTLRRTFARAAYRGGARIEVIAGLLGHCDTKTTLKYIGLPAEDAAEALGNLKW